MPLQFILGQPGSGKTSFCVEEILTQMKIASPPPLYYMVPEQFSLQSERLILSYTSAATKVQVLSFNRLAFRLFSAMGGLPRNLVSDLGKQMILRKTLLDVAGELEYYKSSLDKLGFIDSLSKTITEFTRYQVDISELLHHTEKSSPALYSKLRDTELILKGFRKNIKAGSVLTDDVLGILSERLKDFEGEEVKLLEGAMFWVDGFSGFTPHERAVLLALMKRCAKVAITFTINDELSLAPRETMGMLLNNARNNEVEVMPDVLLGENHRHKKAHMLEHFVKYYPQPVMYTGSHNEVEVIAGSDSMSECHIAAAKIIEWVGSSEMSFRDIAILCGDRVKYEKPLQRIFDRLNIPLFVDTEISILSHPLTELIRSVIDMPIRNKNHESVFRFLRTGLTGIPIETIDILDNYVLEKGIKSFRWRYKFNDPRAEEGRLLFHRSIEIFDKIGSDYKDTVVNFVRRVFELLDRLDIKSRLQQMIDDHIQKGDPATAGIHRQIWPTLCEVFDKLVEVLGEETLTLKEFGMVLDAGLGQVGLGRIPPSLNQVILGDIMRSRYPEIKAMIVIGANEGSFPPIPKDQGVFTDFERTMLQQKFELAPSNLMQYSELLYNIYSAMSQPVERLVVTYAEVATGGKLCKPSMFLKTLVNMFPGLVVQSPPALSEYGELSGKTKSADILASGTADLIYGKTIVTSATRLESFSKCPFAFFMNYVLNAYPRKEHQVLHSDLGTIFHNVITGFVTKLREGQGSDGLDRASIGDMVHTLTQNTSLENEVLHSSARNRHVLAKVTRVASASCHALWEHINSGVYEIAMTEGSLQITTTLNESDVRLSGRVDRVDTFRADDGTEYVKIIDYKSGRADFDHDEVRKGVQLQLMLYLNALLEGGSNKKPGGVFYFPIDDPIIHTNERLSDEERERALLKEFRMSGIVSEEALDYMDQNLGASGESNVISVKKNKDGSISKASGKTVIQHEEFMRLANEAKEKMAEILIRMKSGDISAKPYKSGKYSPCTYCNYDAVCGVTST